MTQTTQPWPALPFSEWRATYRTLHMWTQVVGKVRLAHAPYLNHCWQTALYVTPRGLTTSSIPYGDRQFEVRFDFIDHELTIADSVGGFETIALAGQSVAEFYQQVLIGLDRLAIITRVWPMPVEVPEPTPFDQDTQPGAYDRDAVTRLHQILLQVDRVFKVFRGQFIGKSSPVHFFWGAFDLAVTRFSGAPNPNPPTIPVMDDAYSHEVVSHGFWPGGVWPTGGTIESPIFYAYAVPEPENFRTAPVADPAYFDETLGEYILPYDAVRTAENPERLLIDFMQQTYAAGAAGDNWDRAAVDRGS